MHHTGNGVSIRLDKPKKVLNRMTAEELRHEKMTQKIITGPVGKNEFQDSIVVLQSVYNDIDQAPVREGLSHANTLTEYQTAPVMKLLEKRTWRDFFDEMRVSGGPYKFADMKEKERLLKEEAARNRGKGNDSKVRGTGSPQSGDRGQLAIGMQDALDEAFMRMHHRVELLWDEVKLSKQDKNFYRSSLLKYPVSSVEQCKEVARYIRALQMHRNDTIDVLRSIAVREQTLQACFDSFTAVHRRMRREGGNEESGRPPLVGKAREGLVTFWRDEICRALVDLQSASLEVVRRIQAWRHGLWRPKPFIYQGQNYLTKVKLDMGMVESETYKELLRMLRIPADSLLLVSFGDPSMYARQPLDDGAGANTSTSDKLEADFHALAMGARRGGDQIEGGVAAEKRESLVAAGTVVMEEDMLQRALVAESQTLRKKRVFIPSLKVPTSLDEMRRRDIALTGGQPQQQQQQQQQRESQRHTGLQPRPADKTAAQALDGFVSDAVGGSSPARRITADFRLEVNSTKKQDDTYADDFEES